MDKTINYKVHISIILFLYVVQFFTPNLTLFLRNYQITAELKNLNTFAGKLYKKEDYTPLTPAVWGSGIPDEYDYVYVKKIDDTTEEIFYTIGKRCEKTIFMYKGGSWKSTTHYDRWPIMLFLVIPLSGFVIAGFGSIHRWLRLVGKHGFSLFYIDMFTEVYVLGSGWHDFPLDKVEKISLLYGVPLFASAVVFAFRHSL